MILDNVHGTCNPFKVYIQWSIYQCKQTDNELSLSHPFSPKIIHQSMDKIDAIVNVYIFFF